MLNPDIVPEGIPLEGRSATFVRLSSYLYCATVSYSVFSFIGISLV